MKRNEMDRLWLEQIGAFVDGFQGVSSLRQAVC